MDFLVVPTLRFQLFYVWFVLDHARRRVIHFNVTPNPTSSWVIQRLRQAFRYDRAPRYLLRAYVTYYNTERVHTRLHDAPDGRPTECRPSPSAKVIALPRVGGLYHRYVWQQAA
jgi:hypothetical protein